MSKTKRNILIAVLIVLLTVFAIWLWIGRADVARLSVQQVTGARPEIAAPRPETIPTHEVAEAVGWPQGRTPIPAAGLKVAAFARDLDHPRWLYKLPNGDVLVAESRAPAKDEDGGIWGFFERLLMDRAGAAGASPNRIILLRDTNHDGVADARSTFMTGLNSPFGMALLDGYLYIGDNDALVRVPYQNGETRITAKPEKVIDLPHGGGHWTRNVLVGPDKRSLYVTVGSATNIANDGMDKEQYRANILQVDPVAKTFRIYAAGMRNPNGLAYEPRSGRLWAVVNERDMLSSDGPPDYMSAVEMGDFFGWPWYYWGGYPDNRVDPPNPGMQQYSKRPDYALGPHVAALGIAFANGADLGARFQNGAFVTEHGSWNRVPPSGYKVVFVPFQADGFPVKGAKPVDVLTGFLSKTGDKAYGRPVGIIVGPDSGLLIADDVGNTIWRVVKG